MNKSANTWPRSIKKSANTWPRSKINLLIRGPVPNPRAPGGSTPWPKPSKNLTNPSGCPFSLIFHCFLWYLDYFQTSEKYMKFGPFDPIQAPIDSQRPRLFESGLRPKSALPKKTKIQKTVNGKTQKSIPGGPGGGAPRPNFWGQVLKKRIKHVLEKTPTTFQNQWYFGSVRKRSND